MRGSLVAGCLFVGLAGCAGVPAPTVTWDDVAPLVAPLTYRMLIVEQCDPHGDVPLPFDRELAAAGISELVVAAAHDEIARLRTENSGNLDEYVCTPEMFEQSEAAAAEAQAAWDALKG